MMLEAKGTNGRITFDGRMVTLHRDTIGGRNRFGNSEKSIPVESITAVQFRPGVAWVWQGFLQLTISGGMERRSKSRGQQQRQAFADENSLTFYAKSNADVEAIRDAINSARS